MTKFKVNIGYELRHNGRKYFGGDSLELNSKQAEPLLKGGHIQEVEELVVEVIEESIPEPTPEPVVEVKKPVYKPITKKKSTKKEK